MIKLFLKLYSKLLYLYPASYREEYTGVMEDYFEQEYEARVRGRGVIAMMRFWIFILKDLIRSVPREHYASFKGKSFMKKSWMYLPGLMAGIWIGFQGLKQTDMGMVVGLLLLISFCFGAFSRGSGWIYGMILGVFIPALELTATVLHFPVYGMEQHQVVSRYVGYGETSISVLSIFISLTGVYMGRGIQKIYFHYRGKRSLSL